MKMEKKCKGCGWSFDGLPSEDYCEDCLVAEEDLWPWEYVTGEDEDGV